jgi:hypothetical protein
MRKRSEIPKQPIKYLIHVKNLKGKMVSPYQTFHMHIRSFYIKKILYQIYLLYISKINLVGVLKIMNSNVLMSNIIVILSKFYFYFLKSLIQYYVLDSITDLLIYTIYLLFKKIRT